MSEAAAIAASTATNLAVNALMHWLHARWTARKLRKHGVPLDRPL